MKLSEHFTFEEITDSTSHPELVPQNRKDAENTVIMKHLKYTVGTLEEIRTILGVKIKVTSGYRNTELNNAVGGSITSKHKNGLCADIKPLEKYTIKEVFELLIANKDKCPSLRKCIIEGVKGKEWLHIQAKIDKSEPVEFYSTNDGKNYTKVG